MGGLDAEAWLHTVSQNAPLVGRGVYGSASAEDRRAHTSDSDVNSKLLSAAWASTRLRAWASTMLDEASWRRRKGAVYERKSAAESCWRT